MTRAERQSADARLAAMTTTDKDWIMQRLRERAANPADRIETVERSADVKRRERLAKRKAADASYREAKAERDRERRARR